MISSPSKEYNIDHTLIKAICGGDERALGSLYERHIDKMLGFARMILGNQSDAEDVIHDVFMEIWHKAASYDASRGSIKAWLMLRVRSRSLDRLRSLKTQQKYARTVHAESDNEAANDALLDHLGDFSQLHRSLNHLTEKQRNVIHLSFFKGLSCAEIARQCGIPLGTVKTRMMAAMGKLRAFMGRS